MPRPVPHCSAGPAALALWNRFSSGQQKTTERAWKSGSVLYNFIDTKLNFDTNRLSAVCKHDICCTRAAAAAADADSFRLTVNSSSSPVQHSSAQLGSGSIFTRYSPLRCLSQNVQLFYLVQMWPAIKVPDSNSATRHCSQPTMQLAAGQAQYTLTHTHTHNEPRVCPTRWLLLLPSFYFVYEIQLKSAKKKYRGQQRKRERETGREGASERAKKPNN